MTRMGKKPDPSLSSAPQSVESFAPCADSRWELTRAEAQSRGERRYLLSWSLRLRVSARDNPALVAAERSAAALSNLR